MFVRLRLAVVLVIPFVVHATKLLKVSISSSLTPRTHENIGCHVAGRETDSGSLHNYVFKVVATVKTGNNQTFNNVLVDTGSAILWVGGQQPYVPGSNTQKINQTFSIGYGTGGASGIAYRDHVEIGEATANFQIIGAANKTDGFSQVKPIDGILGLGPSKSNKGEVSGFNTTPTFVETLVSQGSIDNPLFGLYIQPMTNTSLPASFGELTFGGADPNRIRGDISWLPQTPPLDYHWEFNVSGMTFGTVSLKQTAPGRTDSGVLSLEIPNDQFFDILHAYNGTLDPTPAFEAFLCFPLGSEMSLPSFKFTLGDTVFSIPPSQYIIPSSLYPSLNMTADRIHTWIAPAGPDSYNLGQKFLEKVYTVYDMENHRVGFAHTS